MVQLVKEGKRKMENGPVYSQIKTDGMWSCGRIHRRGKERTPWERPRETDRKRKSEIERKREG